MMSLDNLIPSSDVKDESINKIVSRFNRKKILIFKICIFVLLILINIFPIKPKIEESTRSDLDILELESTSLGLKTMVTPTLQFIKMKDDSTLITVFNRYKEEEEKFSIITKIDQYNREVFTVGGADGILLDEYSFYPIKAVELTDSTIISFGSAKNDHKEAFALLHIDSNGQIIDYKILTHNDINDLSLFYKDNPYFMNELYFDLVPAKDGGYTVFISETKTLMIHFSEDDETQWTKLIDHRMFEDYNIVNNVAVDEAGNYYIPVSHHIDNYTNNYIVKLSNTGEILWERLYDFDINSLSFTKNNRLIVSGTKYIDYLRINGSVFFIFYEYLTSYGGKYYAVTAEADTDDGKISWIDHYYLRDQGIRTASRFSNLETLEDSNGNLYSHLLEWFGTDFIEYFVKYDANGNRLGEVIIDPKPGFTRSFYLPNAIIVDDEIVIFDIYFNKYRKIDLDEINFIYTSALDINQLEPFTQLIQIRVWTNRIVLFLFVLSPVFRILYDKYIINRNVKRYIDWN